MRKPGSALELERVRLIAAKMFERGVAAKQIASDLDVSVKSVHGWRRVWRQSGVEGLRHQPHPGRPCLLSDPQKQELLKLLGAEPASHGFDRHFWTTQMIAELIQQKFGVEYHHDWVGQMLHGLGLSWQKPMRRARERDEAKIAAWRSDHWPALLKKALPSTG